MGNKNRIDYSIRFQLDLNSNNGKTIEYIKKSPSKESFEDNIKNFVYIYYLPFRLYSQGYSQKEIEIAYMHAMDKIKDLGNNLYYFFYDKDFSVQFNEQFSLSNNNSEDSEDSEDSLNSSNKQEIQDTQELFDF